MAGFLKTETVKKIRKKGRVCTQKQKYPGLSLQNYIKRLIQDKENKRY